MSPKTADPAIRAALIEEAARVLGAEGKSGLSTRRLAAAVGVSTMAVYTHFGGMDDLRRAVRIEGFTRLAQWLDRVQHTDDPVADVSALGVAYFANASANPNLYRAMFLEEPVDDEERDVCLATFSRLVEAVARCIDSRAFTATDAWATAMQLWAMTHGVASLHVAGVWPVPEAAQYLSSMGTAMLLGLGVPEHRASQAVTHAATFFASTGARPRQPRRQRTAPRSR